MTKAMFGSNKSLFNPLHKSFYNEEDLNILEQAKIIVASGPRF